jgi:glutamine amidotransferase
MQKLNVTGLVDFVKEQALEEKKPILGICLGMQLLGRKSEEGSLEGLSLIPFESVRFQLNDTNLRVPHM